VFKGHLFVGDVLLSESGMRQHPLTPMTDANLVRVMQAQTRRRVGLVPQDVVAQGPAAIRERFAALQAQGVGVAVLDAVSNDDLMRIGPALAGMPLVTAGSGIAIGLPQNWPGLQGQGEDTNTVLKAAQLPPASGLQAVVSGSCSVATNAQVQQFMATGRPSFAVDPLAIAAGNDVAAQALLALTPHLAGGPVLAYATAAPTAVRAVQAQLGADRAGALVEDTLSRIAQGLVDAGVRQLVVAGGETSGAVVQALGVQRMAIGPQITPGVPWTAVQSPRCEGEVLHMALKSGNFGGKDFFAEAFARLAPAT
jgi:uncharacterized protein YgbK (DUF1537 family)